MSFRLEERIHAGDTVLHRPSGENWFVCGVNYEQGCLIPCGYPFPSIGNIADCKLLERGKGQTKEMRDALLHEGFQSYLEKESEENTMNTTDNRAKQAGYGDVPCCEKPETLTMILEGNHKRTCEAIDLSAAILTILHGPAPEKNACNEPTDPKVCCMENTAKDTRLNMEYLLDMLREIGTRLS